MRTLSLLLFCLSSHSSLVAQKIYVDQANPNCPGTGTLTDPFCKVQSGIQAATPGGTVLVMPGVYRENIDFLGKRITVRSAAGWRDTVLDANGRGSVVRFATNESRDSVLHGFTIRGGVGTVHLQFAPGGGGIFCLNSAPTVSGNVIVGNRGDGAGLVGIRSRPRLVGNVFRQNQAPTWGGALFFVDRCEPLIERCIFDGNNTGRFGGAANIYETSAATFTNCVFLGNSASNAGGAMNIANGSTATIDHCTFYGNVAGLAGGAISSGADRTMGFVPRSVISNSILWGNSANTGAEIALITAFRTDLEITYSDVCGGQINVQLQGSSQISWGVGMISRDPLFVDPTLGDIHLRHGSPCRSAALPGAATTDFEGDGRPTGSGPDIGADEFAPHVYQLADPVAGQTTEIRIIGEPNDNALLLVAVAQTPPVPFPPFSGSLEVQLSSAIVFPIGSVPQSGSLVIRPFLPPNLKGAVIPSQALIGLQFSNVHTFYVR